MTKIFKRTLTKYLYLIGILLTCLSTFVVSAGVPFLHGQQTIILGGIIGFLSAINTTWYQYLSEKIPNKVAMCSVLIAIVSSLGALNEFISIVPMNDSTSKSLTWIISLLSLIFQVWSKMKYVPKDKV
jgi:NADH:ubiquinone oxidoreductase subunit 6 (subunit J)